MPTKGLDDLFTTQAQREDDRLEKVRDLPLGEIDEFPGHPFKVKDDESMAELASSIAANGVQTPITVRGKEDGRYEIVSGHRRKRACEIAGLDTVPAIVREMSRDEAIIYMVDSNLQRERILPSEKAFAFKMKLDAMNRQGQRTDLTCSQVGNKLAGVKSAAILATEVGESKNQVFRFIRLTELIPDILEKVDQGRIAFNPAVELSYLPKETQETLFDIMEADECTPSLSQAQKMKRFCAEGKLTDEVVLSIMAEEKPNQVEVFKMPRNRIAHFFAAGTKKREVEDTIVKALEYYLKRERTREREEEDYER
jgi:ParB family chromosome partitioning protein